MAEEEKTIGQPIEETTQEQEIAQQSVENTDVAEPTQQSIEDADVENHTQQSVEDAEVAKKKSLKARGCANRYAICVEICYRRGKRRSI